jgi:hypothetical protein
LNNASFLTPSDALTTQLAFVGATQVFSGIISLPSTGIVVTGNLILSSGSTLHVVAGGVVTVTGLVVIQPGAALQLTGVSDAGGLVQVLTYSQLQGNSSVSGCPTTATPVYGFVAVSHSDGVVLGSVDGGYCGYCRGCSGGRCVDNRCRGAAGSTLCDCGGCESEQRDRLGATPVTSADRDAKQSDNFIFGHVTSRLRFQTESLWIKGTCCQNRNKEGKRGGAPPLVPM